MRWRVGLMADVRRRLYSWRSTQRAKWKNCSKNATTRIFIARRRQKRLLELMGKLEWDTSFDYKAERSRR